MTSLNSIASNAPSARRAPAARADDPAKTWRKAMARFQTSLQKIKPAMDAYADVEETMFAARRALEAMTPPASLTVRIQTELYFNDGMSQPLIRQTVQERHLHDEESIFAFARDDVAARDFLLGQLNTWRAGRALLEAAYEEAKAASAIKEKASSAAISRSDAAQLRVIRTPSPSWRELCWKIETLHKADCDDRCEKLGWQYVLQEMVLMNEGEAMSGAAH